MTNYGRVNGKKATTPDTLGELTHARLTAPTSFAQETAFVGRERELAAIEHSFQELSCHLLSLVGLGGVGKTRIAWEVAARLVEEFQHGVYFVSLAAIDTADLIAPAIATAIRLTFQGSEPTQIQLIDALRSRQILLILDNFEHLIPGGVDFLTEILQAAPAVRLLITSRERLHLREEWVIDIHGLDYPADETDAEKSSAVQLFIQNARRVKADFQLTDSNRADVVRICRLIEGLPLGIELASAWVRVLSCRAIGDEIARSLDFLTTSFRNVPEKHRSMRAVFARTYGSLTAEHQGVFNRLSVFRGGFQRAAAEAVAGASLTLLAGLVDKSLLRVNEEGCYDMHELLRQYGEEQLEASAEGDDSRDVHSAYYADFLDQRVEDLKGRRQLEAIAEINVDFENIRAAWHWAAVRKHEGTIGLMIDGLSEFCELCSRQHESQVLFRNAEQQFAPERELNRLWGRLLVRAAWGEGYERKVETALQVAHLHDDLNEIAFCLKQLGMAAYNNREYAKAIDLLEQSLTIYRQSGDQYATASVLFMLMSQTYLGTWDEFERYGQESLRLRREIGDRVGAAWSLSAVAVAEARAGRFVEAERLWLERIALGHQTGNMDLAALGYAHLSYQVYFIQGDFAKARTAAEEALRITASLHHSNATGWALAARGLLASMEEHYQEGKDLCQQGASVKGHAYNGDLAAWGSSIASCGLGDYDAASEFLLASMRYMSQFRGLPGCVACLPIAAIILSHRSEKTRAVELLGLAFTHPVRASGWMEKWPLLSRLRTELEQALGEEAYAAAWERGNLLDPETAVSALQTYFAPKNNADPSFEDSLTERELEVLRLVAAGLSNREIAEQLFLAVSTVKWYLGTIMSKLQVSNRTQAARRAQELNLLS